MGTVIATIGAWLATDGVKMFLKKAIVLGALVSFFCVLISMFVLPQIILPDSLFNVLVGSELTQIFKGVDFFIPLSFVMMCFSLIMGFRIFSFLWSFILWFYGAFKDGVVGSK